MSETNGKNLCQYFEEDLVYQIEPNGSLKVGVVVECNENSDSDDDDDESESMPSKLSPGDTKIAWYPKGRPQIVLEKKVRKHKFSPTVHD